MTQMWRVFFCLVSFGLPIVSRFCASQCKSSARDCDRQSFVKKTQVWRVCNCWRSLRIPCLEDRLLATGWEAICKGDMRFFPGKQQGRLYTKYVASWPERRRTNLFVFFLFISIIVLDFDDECLCFLTTLDLSVGCSFSWPKRTARNTYPSSLQPKKRRFEFRARQFHRFTFFTLIPG